MACKRSGVRFPLAPPSFSHKHLLLFDYVRWLVSVTNVYPNIAIDKQQFVRFRPKAASRHAIGRCFADHRTGRSCIMQHLERLGRNRAVQNGNQAAIRQSIGEAASLVRREMCWIPALFQAVALSFVSDPREQGAMTAKGFALACFSHRSSC
jgi:hypothetical protein